MHECFVKYTYIFRMISDRAPNNVHVSSRRCLCVPKLTNGAADMVNEKRRTPTSRRISMAYIVSHVPKIELNYLFDVPRFHFHLDQIVFHSLNTLPLFAVHFNSCKHWISKSCVSITFYLHRGISYFSAAWWGQETHTRKNARLLIQNLWKEHSRFVQRKYDIHLEHALRILGHRISIHGNSKH